MSTKSPECWATDPQARGLRVEISAERSIVLPYDQFAFAELTSEGKTQSLRLVFATHEIMVRGYALRRIETAVQRMELSLLAALPSNYQRLIVDGQPGIVEIILTATADSAPASSVGSSAAYQGADGKKGEGFDKGW